MPTSRRKKRAKAAGLTWTSRPAAACVNCGIGWTSLVSIVSESVDSQEMDMRMGVFNANLVLPALMVPGLLKLSDALQGHRWMFLLFAACLLVSMVFWCAVREKESGPG